MDEILEMLPSDLMKIKWLREKRQLLTINQKAFLEQFTENRPLDPDDSLLLGQLYREIQEIESLPGDHDRLLQVEVYESCGRVG